MSVDELPYCGYCGTSHEGEHGGDEFCSRHPDTLMYFDAETEEVACPQCEPEAARLIMEGA